MSFPRYVALTNDGGHVRFENVGRAIAWVADNGGHVYEKLGLTTAQKVCAEDAGLDPAAVARVVEAAKKWGEACYQHTKSKYDALRVNEAEIELLDAEIELLDALAALGEGKA